MKDSPHMATDRSRNWRSRLRGSAILMVIAILGITGFQAYWLKNNYDREKQSLDIKTNAAFRQTILKLQASKLKLEKVSLRFDSTSSLSGLFVPGKKPGIKKIASRAANQGEPPISIMNLMQEKMRDSLKKLLPRAGTVLISMKGDTLQRMVIDTTKGVRTTMRTISLVSPDSLHRNPGMVEDIVVNNPPKKPGKKITFTYSGDMSLPLPNDSAGFPSKTDLILEKQVPMATRDDLPGLGMGHVRPETVFQLMYDVDSLAQKDSITLREVDSAYAQRLKEERLNVDFTVNRLDSTDEIPPNAVTIGFSKPASYQFSLQGTIGYLFDKLKLPILFSLLLVGITIASFVLLYRNMLKQQRLAELKNEFISNITHELKTPIATVGVAIEALKSFNAIHDTKRTEEYLDISQNELQRLNLLVDKVLKLSMFEKKELELKYETLDLKDIVNEVVGSMRLQLEKYRAQVDINVEGDCTLEADRLHLLSVVFNLLDNALKYGKNEIKIDIGLEEQEQTVVLKVADNGIGIPAEYRDKVFEKFFRIPHGNTHNAKGYGLGLSYVAQVVKKHNGTIQVQSNAGDGATFVITLPKQANGFRTK